MLFQLLSKIDEWLRDLNYIIQTAYLFCVAQKVHVTGNVEPLNQDRDKLRVWKG
jgi:hypothetical protein